VTTASAAVITNDLYLRNGPGTRYRVIDTMPAGTYVDLLGCGGSWCHVDWHGLVGFASASYLARGGGAYAYAYAPPTMPAPPPVVRFRCGFSTGPRWHHHRDRHHRRGWRH
jgi:uncharacterized protein YraI